MHIYGISFRDVRSNVHADTLCGEATKLHLIDLYSQITRVSITSLLNFGLSDNKASQIVVSATCVRPRSSARSSPPWPCWWLQIRRHEVWVSGTRFWDYDSAALLRALCSWHSEQVGLAACWLLVLCPWQELSRVFELVQHTILLGRQYSLLGLPTRDICNTRGSGV